MAKKKITKVTSTTDESQQNAGGISQETENKKEKIKETLQEKDIAQTIEFFLGENPGEVVGAIEEIYNKLYLAINKSQNEELSGAMIIKTDYCDKENNIKVYDYAGIQKAFDLAIQNPEKKIILVDIVVKNLDDYKNYKSLSNVYEANKDKIQLMNQAANIRFLHFSSCDFMNTIKLNKFFKENKIGNVLYHKLVGERLKGLEEEELKNSMETLIKTRGFDPHETVKQLHYEDLRSKLSKEILEYEEPIEVRKKTNELTNEAILDTMQFYEVSGWFPYLKEYFATLDLAALNLQNSIVVDLRADAGDTGWKDMSGLRMAYETLQKDANAKIILCSLIPVDVFKAVIAGTKSEEYLDALLQGKNIRIIQSSGGSTLTDEEVLKQFDGMYQADQQSKTSDSGKIFKQLSAIESETAFHKILEQEISHFLHSARHRVDDEVKNLSYEGLLEYFFPLPQEKKPEKRIAFESKMIGLLQFQHPSFKDLPRENNLQGILDAYKYISAQALPEGTRFEGVFVDRDGTLYDNTKKQFNQKIIDMINDYEKQGKKIIIRTQGNLKYKQKLLDEIRLPYVVQSKTDYKGATVELAIDNDPSELLYANAKIKAEKYVQV